MSVVFGAILIWVAVLAFALAFRTPLVLRLHGASLVRIDQAPLAYAVLADLSLATGIRRPRLFVISAASETSLDRVFATQPASAVRVARLRAVEARA